MITDAHFSHLLVGSGADFLGQVEHLGKMQQVPTYLRPEIALKMVFDRHRRDHNIADTDPVHVVLCLDELLKLPNGKANLVLGEACGLMAKAADMNGTLTVFATTLHPSLILKQHTESGRPVELISLPALQNTDKLFNTTFERMLSFVLGGVRLTCKAISVMFLILLIASPFPG